VQQDAPDIVADFLQFFSLIVQDGALVNSFASRHPDAEAVFTRYLDLLRTAPERAPPKPFPPQAEITALQCTIWDNWIEYGGRRPKRGSKGHNVHRYKATIQVWTAPYHQINIRRKNWQHSFEVMLYDSQELAAKATDFLDPKKRYFLPDYAATLTDLAQHEVMTNALGGPLYAKIRGHGTHYPEGQIVVTDGPVGPSTQLRLMNLAAHEGMEVTGFTGKDAAHRPLKGNALLQSRMSSSPALSSWIS
jgi:hypothetical protein